MRRSHVAVAGTSLAVAVGALGYAIGRDQAPTGALPLPCDDPLADAWVRDARDRVLSFDGLVRYAVERYGEPTTCEGAVTTEFDGMLFGTLRLTFAGGAIFEMETMPPEASVVTLQRPEGFDDASGLREAFVRYVNDIGVEVDWTATPEITEQDGRRTEQYWDPDTGLNASASLVFEGDRLVAVRFSMAL